MTIQLSIIVAAQNADHLTAWLAKITPQLLPTMELVVVDSSQKSNQREGNWSGTWLNVPTSTLVPVMWKMGIEASQGEWVALTIAECLPDDQWLNHLMQHANTHPWAAVGGAMLPPDPHHKFAMALYYSRYSAYMPSRPSGLTSQTAADNALYRRDALNECQTQWQDGFWEYFVNQWLSKHEHQLYFDPALRVQLQGHLNIRQIIAHRFQHGRHFASVRQQSNGLGRLGRGLTSPLLPILLYGRALKRIQSQAKPAMSQFLRATPWFLIILMAWSLGEGAGYWLPIKRPHAFIHD